MTIAAIKHNHPKEFKVNWKIIFNTVGIISGIGAFLAFLIAPAFYLGVKIDAIHDDLGSFKTEMHQGMADFRIEMHQTMKDFHGRLCTLEEKYHQIEQKRD